MAAQAPPDSAGRVPPQNLEAEASVLGAVLLSDRALDGIEIDVGLRPDDFYRPRHAEIFRTMVALKARSQPVDAVTVCDELGRAGQLGDVGGPEYVHSLPSVVPSGVNAAHYARIVREHALVRRLIEAARETQEEALGFAGDARELVERAEARLFQVAHSDHKGDVRSIGDVLHDELDRLERVSREGLDVTGTPSGFKELDKLTGGFQPGNLVVVAARPSMGKSALVSNIAEHAAVDHGRPIVLFSLEMSEAEVAQRLIASQAREDGNALRRGHVKKERWPRILRATQKLADAPLYVDDSSDLGIHELRAKARRLHQKSKLGLVIVDYLQLMRPEDHRMSRVEQVGQFSRGLKILAGELEVPVIGVSQLSRAPELRPDKRPILSDLRESGQIEQDADLVLFLYRDEVYNRDSEHPGEAELILAKHRNGPLGRVGLAFLDRHPKFADLAFEHQAAAAAQGPGSNGAG